MVRAKLLRVTSEHINKVTLILRVITTSKSVYPFEEDLILIKDEIAYQNFPKLVS